MSAFVAASLTRRSPPAGGVHGRRTGRVRERVEECTLWPLVAGEDAVGLVEHLDAFVGGRIQRSHRKNRPVRVSLFEVRPEARHPSREGVLLGAEPDKQLVIPGANEGCRASAACYG